MAGKLAATWADTEKKTLFDRPETPILPTASAPTATPVALGPVRCSIPEAKHDLDQTT